MTKYKLEGERSSPRSTSYESKPLKLIKMGNLEVESLSEHNCDPSALTTRTSVCMTIL